MYGGECKVTYGVNVGYGVYVYGWCRLSCVCRLEWPLRLTLIFTVLWILHCISISISSSSLPEILLKVLAFTLLIMVLTFVLGLLSSCPASISTSIGSFVTDFRHKCTRCVWGCCNSRCFSFSSIVTDFRHKCTRCVWGCCNSRCFSFSSTEGKQQLNNGRLSKLWTYFLHHYYYCSTSLNLLY